MSQSIQKYRDALRGLRQNASLAIGAQAEATCKRLDSMIELADRDQTDPVMIERAKVLDALQMAAIQGSSYTYSASCELQDGTKRMKGETVSAKAEVSKIQLNEINNFIFAQSSALEFFEQRNFADKEVPFFHNTTQSEVALSLVGQDGGIMSRNGAIVPSQSQYQLPGPFNLATELSTYQLIDFQRGNVADLSLALIDQARDWSLSLDNRLWKSLQTTSATAGAGTTSPFKFTGPKEKRTFNLHSTIYSANLPQTNILDCNPNGGRPGYIDKTVLDAIVLYARRLSGTNFGPIKPMAIYFPSAIDLQVITTITQTTNDVTASIARQIVEGGEIGNLYGQPFAYRPLPTLDPTGKYVYVRFNKPVGIVGFKPGLDMTFNERYPQKNYGEIGMSKLWTAGIPEQWRPFFARVRYAD